MSDTWQDVIQGQYDWKRDEKSLCIALEDLGIATFGPCREIEAGILQIEFPSVDDAEEFLTLLLVGMSDRAVREPEADGWLYSRIMGSYGGGHCPWKYDALPMDCMEILEPETAENKPIFPYAVSLKVSMKFPVEDYYKILELIVGRSGRSRWA
jgi:hypothetical protein